MDPVPKQVPQLSELATLIRNEREPLLARWRQLVKALPSARHLDVPTLNDHIPEFLEELALALELRANIAVKEMLEEGTPTIHGEQRVEDGFRITEVVSEYNILRGCIHDLAETNGVLLLGASFHIVNRVFDTAIGTAVSSFAEERAEEIKARRQEYLSFVAHDLRTPLSAITLATSLLDDLFPSTAADGETTQLLQTLHRNVAKLRTLVDKVLDENSGSTEDIGGPLERRSFDLWPLLHGLLKDMRPLATEKNVRMFNQVPVDLVVYADAFALARIYQNLLSNALTYTTNGEVRLSAEVGADGLVVCKVSDSGTGIPEEDLERVFIKGEGDPKRIESKGLGLAIVRTLIEAHGGTVIAESGVDRGTVIRFTLPVPA